MLHFMRTIKKVTSNDANDDERSLLDTIKQKTGKGFHVLFRDASTHAHKSS